MHNYGIREGYQIRPEPDYFVDNLGDSAVWQPDAYEFAYKLIHVLVPFRFFDVGCGNGDKTIKAPVSVVGIDTGQNIATARDKHGQHHTRHWYDINLENGLPELFGNFNPNSVTICADVIEHLVNPDPLLRDLAEHTHKCEAVIISTPDRQRLYGSDHNGPPENPHHVREWTLHELADYWRSLGAHITLTGYTRANNVKPDRTTMILAGGTAQIDWRGIAEGVGIEYEDYA